MEENNRRIALVTGGSRGIGRAIAMRLAEDGAFVVINYTNNEAAAERTLSDIKNAGGQGALSRFDVADLESVQQSVEKIAADHGSPDILINNAGITRDTLLLRMKKEDFEHVIFVNLT